MMLLRKDSLNCSCPVHKNWKHWMIIIYLGQCARQHFLFQNELYI